MEAYLGRKIINIDEKNKTAEIDYSSNKTIIVNISEVYPVLLI